MHFGIVLQHFREHASPEAIIEVAQAAEDLGYDSVWVMDHVVVPDVPETHQFTSLVYDPFLTLSYVAARTDRVQIGTSVLIVPYRDPLLQAKQLSTLDALSHGRLTVGMGVGWLQPEFEALGVSFDQRGALMDEYIEVMQTLWMADGPASFHGKTISFDNVMCEPKPVQKPHPPLWIGGSSEAALRRTVGVGDVWHPSSRSAQEISETVNKLRQRIESKERSPIDTIMRAVLHFVPDDDNTTERRSLIGTTKEVRSAIREYQTAGVNGFVLDTFYGAQEVEHKSTQEVIGTLEGFATELMPEFRTDQR